MFPVVFWNIFNVLVCNPLIASLSFFYIILLVFIFAGSFTVVLWNHSAFFNFIVLRHFTAASFFARVALLNATLSAVCAWFIMHV